jgi:hypothetical protein
MAGYDDDRQAYAKFAEPRQEFQAVHPGHLHIQQYATQMTGSVRRSGRPAPFRTRPPSAPPNGAAAPLLAAQLIIVDDRHDAFASHRSSRARRGIKIRTTIISDAR